MTVNELLNTMTKEFRESLWDVFIDDDERKSAADGLCPVCSRHA